MAFQTIATLVRIFGDAPFTIDEAATPITPEGTAGNDLERHAFHLGDGSELLVLWTRAVAAAATVRLPRHAARATEYGVDGHVTGQFAVVDDALTDLQLLPGEPRVFSLK
jgi:hypothetical protein